MRIVYLSIALSLAAATCWAQTDPVPAQYVRCRGGNCQAAQYSESNGSAGGSYASSEGSAGGSGGSGSRARGGFLKKLFHRRSSSGSSGDSGSGSAGGSYSGGSAGGSYSGGSAGGFGSAGGRYTRQDQGCGCGCPDCTGQPGCQCGCADCTCNSKSGNARAEAPSAPADSGNAQHGTQPGIEPPSKPKSSNRGASLTPAESRMVAGINRLRAQHGKPPVEADPLLMKVARERVNTLQTSGNGIGHYSSQYGWAQQHVARYANWASINDVSSQSHWSDGSRETPEQASDAWSTSPGHLRCVLGQQNFNDHWVNRGYDRVGVALGRAFDTAVFGRR